MKDKSLKVVTFGLREKGLLYHAQDDADLTAVISSFKKGYLQASNFFNSQITKIELILVYSRKELDDLICHQTPKWFVGYTDSLNRIVILSPSVWGKESCHNRKGFDKTLCHEITHLFIRQIHKSYEPVWLDEGLAHVVAKQIVRQWRNSYPNLSNSNVMFLLDTKRNWEKTITKEPGMPYKAAFLIVDFLIRRFGKQKIFNLLTGLNGGYNKRRFCQKFEEVYGRSITQVMKEFSTVGNLK